MQNPSTKPNIQTICPPCLHCTLSCPCLRLLIGKPGGYKTSAHLNDGKDIGKDLSGGFYDAGGELKPCICQVHPSCISDSTQAFLLSKQASIPGP